MFSIKVDIFEGLRVTASRMPAKMTHLKCSTAVYMWVVPVGSRWLLIVHIIIVIVHTSWIYPNQWTVLWLLNRV